MNDEIGGMTAEQLLGKFALEAHRYYLHKQYVGDIEELRQELLARLAPQPVRGPQVYEECASAIHDSGVLRIEDYSEGYEDMPREAWVDATVRILRQFFPAPSPQRAEPSGGIPGDILEHEYRHKHGLLGPGECPEKMRKFLSRMRVVGGSLAMNLKDAATFYPENFSTQGINELVEKWNALVSEVVTLEMTTAQVQATDAVAEKSLHCGCPADGRHLVSCPTALGEQEDATKFRQERDAAVNDCKALQIQLQQAQQELAKANTRVRSERRKHIEAELHKP